jgi:3-oxoacyl-(acyl-carrier-protein) synthase
MRQVVVTGIGIISPLGTGKEENLEKLRRGEHGLFLSVKLKFQTTN